MSKFIEDKVEGTHVFIQYKNTDICFDFYCGCGKQFHYDGYFAYVVECPKCTKAYRMPCFLIPDETDDPDMKKRAVEISDGGEA